MALLQGQWEEHLRAVLDDSLHLTFTKVASDEELFKPEFSTRGCTPREQNRDCCGRKWSMRGECAGVPGESGTQSSCYGLNRVPQNPYVKVAAPQSVTLFGDSVIAPAVKVK